MELNNFLSRYVIKMRVRAQAQLAAAGALSFAAGAIGAVAVVALTHEPLGALALAASAVLYVASCALHLHVLHKMASNVHDMVSRDTVKEMMTEISTRVVASENSDDALRSIASLFDSLCRLAEDSNKNSNETDETDGDNNGQGTKEM